MNESQLIGPSGTPRSRLRVLQGPLYGREVLTVVEMKQADVMDISGCTDGCQKG